MVNSGDVQRRKAKGCSLKGRSLSFARKNADGKGDQVKIVDQLINCLVDQMIN